MRRSMLIPIVAGCLLTCVAAQATDWSADTHTLAAGDFNGDGRDDLLVIAKDPATQSAIVLSDETGQPSLFHQLWDSDYLGITWHSETYAPLIGDFNGDSLDDLLLQRKSGGNHFLLHAGTSGDDRGRLKAKAQTISNSQAGISWSQSERRLVVGNFERAQARDDVYLQPVERGTSSAVVLSDTAGKFTAAGPHQTWGADHLGFQWWLSRSVVHAGDFNGDGQDDLLVQAKPETVIIPYADLSVPIHRYRPQSFGIVLADSTGRFNLPIHQLWDRDHLGLDWSAAHYDIQIGDFNGDGYDDVFLKAKRSDKPSYIVLTDGNGQLSSSSQIRELPSGYLGLNWSDASYETVIGDFDGNGTADIYLQARSPAGTNYVATTDVNGNVTNKRVNAPQPPAAFLGGSAVGHTAGEFSVTPVGTASYRVPLAVPQGVAGMHPELSLAYNSRSGNGLLGMGWALGGIPSIARCGSTIATDGVVDGVDLEADDNYCLAGRRLIPISATEYRTEIESFQRIKRFGTAGNGPAYFTVEDKAGLTYQYGGTGDSRIEAAGRAEVVTYSLNRVTDRYGNFIRYVYSEDTAQTAFRPSRIEYGNGAGQIVGRIDFTYEGRVDTRRGYLAGSVVGHDKRLSRITTYSFDASGGTVPVREYRLQYEYGSVTNLSQLTSVLECELASDTCLEATQFGWQEGARGFTNADNTGVSEGSRQNLRVMDVNNDGLPDFTYINNNRWHVRFSRINGALGASQPQAHWWSEGKAVDLDYNGDGYRDIVQEYPYGSSRRLQIIPGGPNGFGAPINTWIVPDALTTQGRLTAAVDIDADGRDDLVYVKNRRLYILKNVWTPNAPYFVFENTPSISAYLGDAYGGGTVQVKDDVGVRVINFDSDGRPDLLLNVQHCEWTGQFEWRNGEPFEVTDCRPQWRVYTLENGGLVETYRSNWNSPANHAHPKIVDVNGDGLSDLVFQMGNRWHTWVSTGEGFVPTWNATGVSYQVFVDYSFEQFWRGGEPIDWFNGQTTVTITLSAALLEDAQVIDYNRDGKSDLLVAHGGKWKVLVATDDGYGAAVLDTGISAVSADRARIADVGGDGLPDILYPSSNWYVAHQRGPISGLLREIVDGLGARTQIVYKPMNTPGLYSGHRAFEDDGVGASFPYQNFSSAMLVVSEFAADNGVGANGAVHTRYQYGGAKLHLQGRGFLGFSEIRAYNENRRIESVNRYWQRFPYTGMLSESERKLTSDGATAGYIDPVEIPELDLLIDFRDICQSEPDVRACGYMNPAYGSVSVAANDVLVNRSENEFGHREFSYPAVAPPNKVYLPYVSRQTELTYPLSGGTAPLKRMVTDYGVPDTWGNVGTVRVEVDDGQGADRHIVETTNQFTNDEPNWCVSQLASMEVTETRSVYSGQYDGPASRTRRSTYTYRPGNTCSLETETDYAGTSQAVTRTYGYDAYGNRTTETISGPGLQGAPRTSSVEYGYRGRFPVTLSNAEGHVISETWDERLGVRLTSTGPKSSPSASSQLTTSWDYDAWGRVVREKSPVPGVYTNTDFDWCGTGVGCMSADAVYAVTATGSDGSFTRAEYDRLGREVHTSTRNFDGGLVHSERHFDPLGREYLASAPYRSGENVCYTFRQFDALDRVIGEWAPADFQECGTAFYSYNANPLQLPLSSHTAYQYDRINPQGLGIETVVSDAEGRVVTEARNVMDRLRAVYETDTSQPSGQQTVMTLYDYDASGNSTWVKDAEGAITVIAYDLADTRTAMDDPSLGAWQYRYNVLGELLWQRDAKGNEVTLEYDRIGRLVKRYEDYPAGQPTHGSAKVTDWVYDTATGDAIGQLASVTGPYTKSAGAASADYSESFQYDQYGRVEQAISRLEGEYYWTSSTYDAQSRLQRLTYPAKALNATAVSSGSDRRSVTYGYNAYGFMETVRDTASGELYWQARDVDALGNITEATFGDALTTNRAFDPATGYLTSITTGTNGNVQNLSYRWNKVGHLTRRDDGLIQRYETFSYDDLQRLDESRIYTSTGSLISADTMAYDRVGNIRRKGGQYQDYRYEDPDHANAVTRVTAGGVLRSYAYDANGNMTSGGGRTVTWTSFNKPYQISRGTGASQTRSTFFYGPDRSRYKQVALRDRANGAGGKETETTLYVGGLFEQVDRVPVGGAPAPTEFRHYVQAGGEVVAVLTDRDNGADDIEYLLRDHLGSVVVITDGNGNVRQRMSFDPWGKRRNEANLATGPPGTFIGLGSLDTLLTRGFTGHEQMDHLGLVHMNGRIYDAEIGRFLSADPIVAYPDSTQGFNRYSYVENNPLSYVDPSGFFFKKLWKFIRQLIPKPLRPIADFIAGFLASGGNVAEGILWVLEGLREDYASSGPSLIDILQGSSSNSSLILNFRDARFDDVDDRSWWDRLKDKAAEIAEDKIKAAIRGAVHSGVARVAGAVAAMVQDKFQDHSQVAEFIISMIPGAGIYEGIKDIREGRYVSGIFNILSELPPGKAMKLGRGILRMAENGNQVRRAAAKADVPRGGTYVLRDPETGQVRRTGRTNDLKRREGEHGRGAETKDLDFEVDRRTDSYEAQRGREQIIYDAHPEADLNRKRPIADKNKRRDEYMREGKKL